MCPGCNGEEMKIKTLMLIVVLFLSPLSSYAFPQFVDIFNNDPFARPDKKNKCSVCHISPNGGGPRNDFGKAFDESGHKITNDIRQQFPELFDLLKALEPKITRVKPSLLFVNKQIKIMILGQNFASDSIVKIDGASENIQSVFVNSKRIDLTITISNAGVHTVQVENATGQISNSFKVKVKPVKAMRR